MVYNMMIEIVSNVDNSGFHWGVFVDGQEVAGVPYGWDVSAVAWQVEKQLMKGEM